MEYEPLFILLHISSILSFIFFILILRMKNKIQLHYAFLVAIALMQIWCVGHILNAYANIILGYTVMAFIYIYYFGLIFSPVSILFLGLVYLKTKIKVSMKLLALLIFPVVDYLMLLTNDMHHLYFHKYSLMNNLYEIGPFFTVHAIVSYIYVAAGLFCLLYATIKSSGFFSKQSSLVMAGIMVPLVVNILTTLRLIVFPSYSTVISYSIGIFFFSFAILRYDFLKISPIALKTVVDRISDSFMVVNEDYQIIDYNEPMTNTFKVLFTVSRNTNLGQILEKADIGPDRGKSLLDCIEDVKKTGNSLSYGKHIIKGNFDRHFTIEITPIILRQNYLGTIILFKDITQNVKAIETIEEKHATMMEQERLASLGQLIGGIAHNLKTPIMSISGAVEGLKDLVSEYEQSIGDSSVTEDDHREIAQEMHTWLDKIKAYCSYMTDIIDTVKGQTIQSSTSSMLSFTVNELVKRIELLLKYELMRHNCKMNTWVNMDINTELQGDVNSLVQVFDNIIINAIQAYDGKSGVIDFFVKQQENSILFEIRDYGKGIPESIKDRLLKEMVTTKGRYGTGLGLYMSNSIIKGRFRGKMWFKSARGRGTTFYVRLPLWGHETGLAQES